MASMSEWFASHKNAELATGAESEFSSGVVYISALVGNRRDYFSSWIRVRNCEANIDRLRGQQVLSFRRELSISEARSLAHSDLDLTSSWPKRVDIVPIHLRRS